MAGSSDAELTGLYSLSSSTRDAEDAGGHAAQHGGVMVAAPAVEGEPDPVPIGNGDDDDPPSTGPPLSREVLQNVATLLRRHAREKRAPSCPFG